jgi:tRNA A37 threonylcarbamoyladenosine modification protein TsaB
VTARTLAQQLDIPLFAVSSLAAIAWAKHTPTTPQTIAVEMPAQRGEVFGGIYEVVANPNRLIAHLSDRVLTPETWQQTLTHWPSAYQLIHAPSDQGSTVASLLDLAYEQWLQGIKPHWSEALPFYGQHPVKG